MLKKWSAVAIGALLAVSIVVVDDVEAEATAASISVDCATGQILAGQTFSAVVVGETITIVNGSSSDACTLSVATSVATVTGTTGTAPSLTLAASGTAVLTVVDSGTFTVADAGAVARTFVIDSCSLTGAGVESDPWRISSQADFRLIGDQTGTNSCILGGHYLQTVDLVLNSWALDQVAGNFSGVYDGDHYNITLGAGNGSNDWDHETRTSGGPSGLFVAVVGGTVEKLQISGTIVSYEAAIGGVARETSAGAVISEVSSGVNITARYGAPVVGGIVGIFGSGNSRVQYSRSSGTIDFPTYSFPGSGLGKASIGGIVGYHDPAGAPQKAEIRDSYSRAVFNVDTTDISDGTGDRFDAIIAATGYTTAIPFLPPDISPVEEETTHVALYNRVVHPRVPGLYFIGYFNVTGGSNIRMMDDQAAYIAAMASGAIRRPSEDAMNAAIAVERAWAQRQFPESPR